MIDKQQRKKQHEEKVQRRILNKTFCKKYSVRKRWHLERKGKHREAKKRNRKARF